MLAVGGARSYVSAVAATGLAYLRSPSEPIFNVPRVVTASLTLFGLIHVIRTFLLSPEADIKFLLLFSFIPARYEASPLIDGALPGGVAADLWTFVTYSLIHGDITHLSLNAVWLLAFGTPVARRFGTMRFMGFFGLTAAAGAATHWATHASDGIGMIGASAAISGFMAGAVRFVFQRGGPLSLWRTHDESAYRVRALSLSESLRDPRVVAFLAVWFGLNLLFGISSFSFASSGQVIAWQAHIGGFLAGLVAFGSFDPVQRSTSGSIDPDSDADPATG